MNAPDTQAQSEDLWHIFAVWMIVNDVANDNGIYISYKSFSGIIPPSDITEYFL